MYHYRLIIEICEEDLKSISIKLSIFIIVFIIINCKFDFKYLEIIENNNFVINFVIYLLFLEFFIYVHYKFFNSI